MQTLLKALYGLRFASDYADLNAMVTLTLTLTLNPVSYTHLTLPTKA